MNLLNKLLAAAAAAAVFSGSFAAEQRPPASAIGTHAPAGQTTTPGKDGHTPLGTYAPGGLSGYVDYYKGMKKLLFIGDLSTGSQIAHDGITHAIATLDRITRPAGIVILARTDTQWISKDTVWGAGDYAEGGKKAAQAHNLNDFDGVIFFTSGEMNLTAKQKADLLSFVRDDGKAFIGVHTGTATNYKWPEYGDMVGAYFDTHPWGITTAKIKVERPDFPGMIGYVADPEVKDEHYQYMDPYLRGKVDVLASIDVSSVDVNHPNVHRTDGDFPIAWIKTYGKGRVFSSHLGHGDAMWDDQRMQRMYLEGIKWAIGMTDYPVRPHPKP